MFFIYCTLIEHLQLHFFSTITAFDLALEKVPVQLELNTAGKGQQTSIPTLQSNFFIMIPTALRILMKMHETILVFFALHFSDETYHVCNMPSYQDHTSSRLTGRHHISTL